MKQFRNAVWLVMRPKLVDVGERSGGFDAQDLWDLVRILVAQMFTSWNQMSSWLSQLQGPSVAGPRWWAHMVGRPSSSAR